MPKHTYAVTIGKDTYDVGSDSELTDGQAYQAALAQSKQAPPDVGPERPPPPETQSANGGAISLAGLKAVPGMASGLTSFAANPNVPKVGSSIGRVIGGVAPAIGGAYESGPVGALAGLAAASKGAWAGGKTGWFTGKMLQGMAAPAGRLLEKAAPYAQALAPISGAQTLGNFAQMVEPTRTDIGVLGIGATPPPVPGQQPAMLNALAAYIKSKLMGGAAPAGQDD